MTENEPQPTVAVKNDLGKDCMRRKFMWKYRLFGFRVSKTSRSSGDESVIGAKQVIIEAIKFAPGEFIGGAISTEL